ncbi:MAG: hypothetical protein WBC80_22005 [Isosphaeraceae bacterium]
MDEYTKLLEKIRLIEALHAGAPTDGERNAAADALRRISERLASLKVSDPPTEYRFSLENTWSRKLFLALLRRYGLRPYRYLRQRRNTVMVRISPSFVDQLWAEFVALDEALCEHLDALAEKVIAESISGDTSEAEEIGGQLTG